MSEPFQLLFKKFVNGLNWLERKKEQGFDVTDDHADFTKNVVPELEHRWKTIPRKEKDWWLTVLKYARTFRADIVDPDPGPTSGVPLKSGLDYDAIDMASIRVGSAKKQK